MEHTCVICTHSKRDEIERKYLQGWRLVDIKVDHPFSGSVSLIVEHAKGVGIFEEGQESRQIKIRNVCEQIIRAGLPQLSHKDSSIHPRDLLEAVKILASDKTTDDIEEIWSFIKRKRTTGKREKKESELPLIPKPVIARSFKAGKILKKIQKSQNERDKRKIPSSPGPGVSRPEVLL